MPEPETDVLGVLFGLAEAMILIAIVAAIFWFSVKHFARRQSQADQPHSKEQQSQNVWPPPPNSDKSAD